MPKDLPTRLAAKEQDDLLSELRTDCIRDLKRSRSKMSRYYSDWDYALETYQQIRDDDSTDIKARKKREPAKQTIPLSYAQVNTFVTYLTMLYTQNQRFFEYQPTGTEDFDIREECEKIIEREVRNGFSTPILVQFLLDIARFNLGVLKPSWQVRTTTITPDASALSFSTLFSETAGLQLVQQTNEEIEVIVKEGTVVDNVSPYNFFPDTRLPMTRWHEGSFAADETVHHIREVKKMDGVEGAGELSAIGRVELEGRGTTRLEGLDVASKKEDDFMVVVTEMQRWLTPTDYELSESKEEELWVIRIGNDQRVLSARKMEDANMGFTYKVAQMAPDQHSKLSDSLSSLIDRLQETVTWLMNTRVEAVKNNIEKQLVVHSQYVELEDLQTRSPFIRMKKNTPIMGGLDNFIQQLKTNDPTVTHIQDADTLMKMMYQVSGVNENAMGSFTGGRRSATEARNVQAGSASRMKLIGSTVYQMALSPLGKQLLVNARQWMSEETFFKILGEDEDTYAAWQVFHKDAWWELIGSEDFFVFDSTSASEKTFVAQSLQELAIALMGNPEVLAAIDIDLVKVIERIQELRGVTNLKQFKRDQPIGPLIPGANGQVPVVPGQPPEIAAASAVA
jgi:hypothetical protein